MSPPPPRRAIIAITSATAPLHDGNPTGLFISEALHPFQVLKAAGFEVDLVSEKGTYTSDWLSLQEAFLSGGDKKMWEDQGGEFRRKLDAMPDVRGVKGGDVGFWERCAGLRSDDGSILDDMADVFSFFPRLVFPVLRQRRACCLDRLSARYRVAGHCHGCLEAWRCRRSCVSSPLEDKQTSQCMPLLTPLVQVPRARHLRRYHRPANRQIHRQWQKHYWLHGAS